MRLPLPYALASLAMAWPLQGLAQKRRMTLDEALLLAGKQSSLILKAEVDVETSGERVVQSYLQWLPNLVIQGNANEARGKNYFTSATPTLVNGSSFGANYQITSTLNIFNGLSDSSSFESIRMRKESAEKTFERAKQQVALDIAQSFYQVVLDSKIVEIASENLKISEQRQRLLEAQSEVGNRTLADVFRQQAQTSADRLSLISSENRLATDKITLMRKLRIDPQSSIDFVDPGIKHDSSLLKGESKAADSAKEALIGQALKNRPDLLATESDAKAAISEVRIAESAYYPKVDFVAAYGSLARDFDYQRVNGVDVTPADAPSLKDQLESHTNYVYGLTLTWNVFDRGLTRTTVSLARGEAYKVKLDTEEFRNQVVGEVEQAINNKHAAVQQYLASESGLQAAQRAYEVSAGRYEVGAANYIDLAAAQAALVQAQTSFAQANISYELQAMAMDFAIGIPL